MKRIATLFLAIVMLVSVMAPVSVFAAGTAHTDPSSILTVTKYTNADNATVPSDETWIHMITKSPAVNGDTLTVGEDGWTSSDGIVSIPANATFGMTVGNTSSQLKTPFAENSKHLYTTSKDAASGFVIYPNKAGIKGAKTLKFWNMRHSSSNKYIGYEVKTASMDAPETGIVDQSSVGNKGYWVTLSATAFVFEGTDDEYVKIYNPTSYNGTTNGGSLRMSTVSFVTATVGASPEKETVTTPTFTNAAEWTNTSGVYSTTANNNTAKFTATDLVKSYYDVYYDLALTGNEATAPAVEFKVNDTASDVATYVYNTGDGYLSSGKFYLGTYELSGASSVSVTKLGGTAELKASAVYFEPKTSAIDEVTLGERETAQYKSAPTIANDGSAEDTSDDKNDYLNFTGTPSRRTVRAGTYQGYCTRAYEMSDRKALTAGYYDVWTYAIVDAESKEADDVKAYVYHNGEASGAIDLNYGDMEDGTRKWIKIGNFYFAGGYINEYVSIGSDSALVRLGGVKFIPAIPEDAIVVQANNSERVTSYPGLSAWSSSSSVALPLDGEKHYYSATRGATITFSAEDLTSGKYDVYYYHAPYYRSNYAYQGGTVNDSIDAEYVQFVVKHNGKTAAQNYDNSADANAAQTNAKAWTWKYMGTYDFAGEGDEYVSLMLREERQQAVLRATAVMFVKKPDVTTFVVAAEKVSNANKGLNVTTSASPERSDGLNIIHEGIVPSYFRSSATENTVTYTLPQHGFKAGTYKVSTLGVQHAYWNGTKLYVTVADKTGVHDEQEIDIVNGEWLDIDNYEFTGDTANEYVQFRFPTATEIGEDVVTGFGPVKFELVSESAPELSGTGTVDVYVEYGVGMETIITKPYMEGEEQGTNGDGSLRWYTEQIPIIVSVTNGTDAALENTAVVYAAVYDASGNLKIAGKLAGGADAIASGETSEHYGVFDRQFEPGDKIVTYVWDTALTPLSVTYPISVVRAE